MVRPHFGPPRYKPRPYTDGHNIVPCEQHYTPNSKSRRDVQDYPGKGPSNWRESRGRGRPPFGKRVPLMGEQRPPPFNHWRSQNQDSFQAYPHQMQPHHSQRRPSPSRPTRPPHVQHQSSSRSPVQGSPGHRGPPFHGHSSVHRSPSPRHYRNHSADRRSGSPPPYQGSFRGPKRQPGFSPPEQRSRDPRGHYSPRERSYEHSPHGMKRWNGAGVFSHPHNGEHGPSSSQRKPRELHGGGPCPERWSAEQDSRRQRGAMEREGRRSHSTEKPQDVHSHLPPFRSPSWKGGQSSSSSSCHNSSQERHVAVSRKRRMPDLNLLSTGPALEHSNPKHPRRERPQLLNIPRPLGGKPMFMRDRGRILKGRPFRPESLIKLRVPPALKPRPRVGEFASRRNISSILAIRKKRFQSNAGPPTKLEPKRAKPHQSPPSLDSSASKSSRDSDTVKEKVESRRSLSTHSPNVKTEADITTKRQKSQVTEEEFLMLKNNSYQTDLEKLSCDLVVVSHWQAGPSSSSKGCSSPRDHSPKSKTERSSDSSASPNSRLSKSHESKSSLADRRGSSSDKRNFRPMNITGESYRPGKPFRRPGPNQRQRFAGGPRRPVPEMSINVRKPLMESFVPRPFPHQKPVFRKSQSIMSKYRNMQVMRQRVPYSRGPNQQRW